MEFDYPYRIEIYTKKEAIYTIKNMCKICHRFYWCSGAMSKKCNEIKDKNREEFSK